MRHCEPHLACKRGNRQSCRNPGDDSLRRETGDHQRGGFPALHPARFGFGLRQTAKSEIGNGLSLLTSAATVLRRNINSVWATEKAAPVSRSGFGIIPDNFFYCTTARKNRAILRTPLRVKVRFCGGNRQTAGKSSVFPWPCRVVPSNPPEHQAASLGSPLFSMECQGSKRACAATLRLWRCFGEAVG